MRVSRLAPSLLMLAVLAPLPMLVVAAEPADGAGLVWSVGAANQPPADWAWEKSASPHAAVSFADDQLTLSGEPGGWSFVQRNLAGQNGSDEQPLAITCAIAASGQGALSHLPAMLTLRWGEKDLIAIGLADHPERKGEDAITWGGWLVDGKRGEERGTIEPYQRESQTQVRILILSKIILAQASRDGFDWRTIITRERKGALAQGPNAVVLGHGWLRPDALDGQLIKIDDSAKVVKDKDGILAPPIWQFSGLRVTHVSSDLPATLTKSYQRKESGDDTRDTIFESTFPSEWRISGPFGADKDPVADGGPDAAGVTWKTIASTGKAADRFLQLDDVLTGGGSGAVRYARFAIACDQPRLERFLFDGLHEATLFVNGRQLVVARNKDEKRVQVDRLGAVTWLRAGENIILVKVVAGPGKDDSRLVLRHEPGDPRYRAAVLKRVLTDFPPEAGLMAAERTEIARAWEATGNFKIAAEAFAEVSAAEDAPLEATVAAYTAQARLHAVMRDDAAQAADIAALAKVWADDGADPLSSALRGARLHTLLGRDDLAVQMLDQALSKAGSTAERLPIAAERMRLHRSLKQEDRVLADMLAIAAELPADDRRKIALLATAARIAAVPAADAADAAGGSPPPAKVPDFSAVKAAALASRRSEDLHLAALAAIGVADHASAKTLAKVMAEVCSASDPLLIFAAEVSGDDLLTAAALKRYLAGVGAPAPDKATVTELRQRVVRARISNSPLGAKLLADADALKMQPTAEVATLGGRTWKAIGPFNNDNWKRYDHPPINPGQPDLTAKVEDKSWREVTPDGNGLIDFNSAGLGSENAVVVMTTEVFSVAAGESILSCGADDGLMVWCNGVKVYEDRIQRGISPDSMKIPLTLKAGANRLTIMVQNGTGGFGFQSRLRDAPYPAIDLARILAAAAVPANAGKPAEFADALLMLSGDLSSEGRPEGLLLAATVLDVFPQQVASGVEAAALIYQTCHGQPTAPTTDLEQAIAWLMRARLAGIDVDSTDFWRDLPFNGGEVLSRIGANDSALELLHLAQLIDPDPYAQARNQLQLAEFYRFTGAARAAIPLFTRVADDPALGPDEARWAREQLSFLRRIKNDFVRLDPPFEAANAARTVQRLAAAQDAEGLIIAAQKLIESSPDLAIPEANGVGRSGWRTAVDALRSVGAPAVEAYRAKYQTRAEGQLQGAAEAGDAAACERVAKRFPLCTTRGPALLRAAELYRDRGDIALARSTAALAMPELTDAVLAARAKLLTALAMPSIAVPPSPVAMRVSFPLARGDVPDLMRLPNRATPCVPVLINGTVVVHHGDAAWGIDAATGIERWRQMGTSALAETFNGLPVWQAGSDGDVLAVRLRAPDRRLAVVVLDPRTGEQRWTSAARPELKGLTAVSSPTASGQQVYAAFGDLDGNRRLAGFDAGSGQLLWLTEIPGRGIALPMLGELDLRVAGHAAPPMVLGRELYWCSDAGVVARIDTGNGGLMWAAPYARSVIDPTEGLATLTAIATRGPSRIFLTGDRLVVAPRDCLAVFALDRVTGAKRWEKTITSVKEIVGIVTGPKPSVIAQDKGLTALDAANGEVVWHNAEKTVRGSALVEPGSIFASVDGAVLRLDSATGKVLTRVPSAEGVREGTLVRAGKALLATGLLTSGDGVITTVGGAAKSSALALADGALLTFSGLPVQDSGPSFGVLARWNGGPVRGIIAPKSGAGNERYVRTATWLARIEPGPQPRLAWQIPIDGETQTWGLTNAAVVGIQRGFATLFDRATGRRLASVPTAITSQLTFGDDYVVWAGPEAITCFKWGESAVEVRDPANGSLWRRFEYDRGVAAATVRNGKLLTIRDGERAVLDIRDARTGAASPLVTLPFDNIGDLRVNALDADRWLVGKADRTIILNLDTGAVADADNRWNWNDQGFSHARRMGDLTGVYRENSNRGYSAVYDPANKIIFQQEHYKVVPAFFSDHAVVQHVDNGILALEAVEYRTGKSLWRFDRDHDWERWPKALLPWGDKTVLVSQRRDGWQRYDVLGADGKVQASGNLAGQTNGPVCVEMIGNQLWVGSSAGLSILAPCTADALKAQGTEVVPPATDIAVRDFNANFIGTHLESSQDEVVIDGDLSDWPEVAPRVATVADHRVPDVPGVARITDVHLRSAFDANQVAFAVEVTETSGAPVHVRLGLDTRGDDGERPPIVVLDVDLVDGVTRVRVVDGSWDKAGDAGTAEPRAWAMRTLTGWRFEIGIPWPLLRSRAEWRPGDRRWFRYGLLAEAPGDAVEFGHGLSTATDWTLWPGMNLLGESRRKKAK